MIDGIYILHLWYSHWFFFSSETYCFLRSCLTKHKSNIPIMIKEGIITAKTFAPSEGFPHPLSSLKLLSFLSALITAS